MKTRGFSLQTLAPFLATYVGKHRMWYVYVVYLSEQINEKCSFLVILSQICLETDVVWSVVTGQKAELRLGFSRGLTVLLD